MRPGELDTNHPDDREEEEGGEELFEHHRLVADPGQSPLRVDKFIINLVAHLSRNKLQTAAKSGYVRVNGVPVKSNHKVKPGDVVTVELPQPVFEFELLPEPMDLDIVFEDPEVLVINKPMNLVVHPGHGNYTGTLVNGVLHHFQSLPSLPNSPEPRPGLVHRLDKDTKGLMVLGKSERALTDLSEQFFERSVERRYWALVWGDVSADGTVEGHVGRSLRDRRVQQVFADGREGKHAVTHYRVLERMGPVTLVECKLETGRTHQIRVHMQYIGHPLFGDPVYGGNVAVKGAPGGKYNAFLRNMFDALPRQALHAKTLGFTHPGTQERMHFNSDLPEDMSAVLGKWRTFVGGAAN
ncbi:MAG: RluA family pseudouridine synthase [Bacteroidetes bacterium]|nr:RluA family pseudouridine synthase [Bacteroidota bacterium]